MPMDSTPVTLLSFSQPVPKASWGVPYDQLKEDTLAWLEMTVKCRHHLKVGSYRATATLRDRYPWWQWSREILLKTEQNFKQCTWLFTLIGRRNGHSEQYIPVRRLWLMVWLDDQGLGKNMTGKLVIRQLGKGYVDRPLWIGKNMKIFFSCECSPKGRPSRRGY